MPLPHKQLIIFDLDGTLAPSKSAIDAEMSELLTALISHVKVAVISGGGYGQFEKQFLSNLPRAAEHYSNLVLLPTSGARFWLWRGNWHEEYAEHLTTKEKTKILGALKDALKASQYVPPATVYGEIIEDRGSQITFSALGQSAPVDVKKDWDPDFKKREKIAAILRPKLPEFDVRLGGSTSIDVTRRGVNKAYGIHRLQQYFNLKPEDITFVGDALFYGGNDYPARSTGVDCIQVKGPEDAKQLIRSWIS